MKRNLKCLETAETQKKKIKSLVFWEMKNDPRNNSQKQESQVKKMENMSGNLYKHWLYKSVKIISNL